MELDPKTPEEEELKDARGEDGGPGEPDDTEPWAKTSSGDADEITTD